MVSISEKWTALPRWFKRVATIVGVFSGLATIYTAAGIFFATPIRPAWAWEITEIAQLQTDLNRQQLQTQLALERINRRDFNRTLNEYRAMRDDYVRKGEPVPPWLIQEISDGEEDVRRTQETINRIQQQIIRITPQ